MQLRLYKPVTSTRQCGECTACCTAVSVVELDKPMNVRCKHICERGCAIYEQRPAGCRGFECAWLKGFLPDKMRPDQSGIVWDLEHLRARGVPVVRAFLMSAEITIEQVEYQLAKIQQKVAERIACLVIPAGFSSRLDAPLHVSPVRENIMIADREAREDEIHQGMLIGAPPAPKR